MLCREWDPQKTNRPTRIERGCGTEEVSNTEKIRIDNNTRFLPMPMVLVGAVIEGRINYTAKIAVDTGRAKVFSEPSQQEKTIVLGACIGPFEAETLDGFIV